MAPSVDWKEVRQLFDLAADLSRAEQDAFLVERCGANIALRDAVRRLLVADRSAFGPNGGVDDKLPSDREELVGGATTGTTQNLSVGNYRILRTLGRGGMGTVYLAEDRSDENKHVALKLLRRQFGDTSPLYRFHREQRLLSMLNHPFIVKLLDVGIDRDGRAYLVTDFIEGENLQVSASKGHWSLHQRLNTFSLVCEAVTYAHGRGIIHRDLKVSNILMHRNGEPRLLDFGIAKIIDIGEAFGVEPLTASWERVLSPASASPEQVTGQAVSIATDIYGLGVVLYRMLTGALPFDFRDATPNQWFHMIVRQPATKPSDALLQMRPGRVSSIAERRRFKKPEGLIDWLRSWGDELVMKAIAKDPGSRYSSVAAFSAAVKNVPRPD